MGESQQSAERQFQVNGWEYQIDAGMPGEGQNFTIMQPGEVIDYLRPHGGPLRVIANDAGVLTLERIGPVRGSWR